MGLYISINFQCRINRNHIKQLGYLLYILYLLFLSLAFRRTIEQLCYRNLRDTTLIQPYLPYSFPHISLVL